MKIAAIDTGRIEAMLAQLKAVAQKPSAEAVVGSGATLGLQPAQSAGKPDFAQALKASLDQVNNVQATADKLGKDFVMGDDKVSLSDVMISMQKANISFQATVQVRNKLVAAYHDIMNMQI